MRPATPDFNFAQPAGPVSPPTTPTSAPTFAFNENRRHGTPSGPHPSTENGAINSTGFGHQSSYTSSTRPEDLIPRSSSEESGSDSEASIGSPPHSLKLSPAAPVSRSVVRERTGIVVEGNFTLEEFTVSDYKEWGIDEEDVVRPNEYEGAESDRARSPPIKSDAGTQPGSETFSGFLELRRDDVEDSGREGWLEKLRAERREQRRQRGSISLGKRKLSMGFESETNIDSDDEELQPMSSKFSKAGASAKRLRQKDGERTSLTFDDPPPRIEEEDEGPEEVEELLEVDEKGEGEGRLSELPYHAYIQQMDSGDEDDVIRLAESIEDPGLLPSAVDTSASSPVAFSQDKGKGVSLSLPSSIMGGSLEMDKHESDNEREAWLEKQRAERRRRRRSSNSVEKRSLSFSIGSDTDDEDLQPFTFEGANEVGSSARRLKRKGGKRTSLIFDDPPVKFDHIDEEDEGVKSVGEFVDVKDDDEDSLEQRLAELPCHVQEMDIHSEADFDDMDMPDAPVAKSDTLPPSGIQIYDGVKVDLDHHDEESLRGEDRSGTSPSVSENSKDKGIMLECGTHQQILSIRQKNQQLGTTEESVRGCYLPKGKTNIHAEGLHSTPTKASSPSRTYEEAEGLNNEEEAVEIHKDNKVHAEFDEPPPYKLLETPFSFEDYQLKCESMTTEQLHEEWEKYTQQISGEAMALTTASSELFAPVTSGISLLGLGLSAFKIHDARKKREIIEAGLEARGAAHRTRKRDVLAPIAITGVMSGVTLGLTGPTFEATGAILEHQQGKNHHEKANTKLQGQYENFKIQYAQDQAAKQGIRPPLPEYKSGPHPSAELDKEQYAEELGISDSTRTALISSNLPSLKPLLSEGVKTNQRTFTWDAYEFFNVTGRSSRGMNCIGINRRGRRCAWDIAKVNYDDLRRILDWIETESPQKAEKYLRDIASLSLCQDFHQNQAFGFVNNWRAMLHNSFLLRDLQADYGRKEDGIRSELKVSEESRISKDDIAGKILESQTDNTTSSTNCGIVTHTTTAASPVARNLCEQEVTNTIAGVDEQNKMQNGTPKDFDTESRSSDLFSSLNDSREDDVKPSIQLSTSSSVDLSQAKNQGQKSITSPIRIWPQVKTSPTLPTPHSASKKDGVQESGLRSFQESILPEHQWRIAQVVEKPQPKSVTQNLAKHGKFSKFYSGISKNVLEQMSLSPQSPPTLEAPPPDDWILDDLRTLNKKSSIPEGYIFNNAMSWQEVESLRRYLKISLNDYEGFLEVMSTYPQFNLALYKQGNLELLSRFLLDAPSENSKRYEKPLPAIRIPTLNQTRKLGKNTQRLRWTCSCGHKSYDDFIEHRPGATVSLANQLFEAGYISHAQVSNTTNTPISSFIMYINNIFVGARRQLSRARSPSLPSFSMIPRTAGVPVNCLPTNKCRWLHMCFKKRPYATKMEPLHVCKDEQQNAYTDASFFQALRKAYYQRRSWKEKLLFKLSKIEFVEFDLCPEDLVDHIIPDKLPTTTVEYEFQPPPPLKKCPPIGASHMMHLFTSCSAQPLKTSLYLRHIPKRKDQALSFQPGVLDDQTGYGLHFVEKLNSSLAVTVMFAVSLIVGIVFAIWWSIRKQDIQGAFGVASYVTSVITLAVMTWQMWSI